MEGNGHLDINNSKGELEGTNPSHFKQNKSSNIGKIYKEKTPNPPLPTNMFLNIGLSIKITSKSINKKEPK